MRFALLLLLYPTIGIIGLFYPIVAAGFFIWNDIFQPLEFAYQPGAFPHAWFVFIVVILSFIFNLLRGRLRPFSTAFTWLTVLFLLWILVCALRSPISGSFDGFMDIAKYLFPIILISTIPNNFKNILFLTSVLTFSVAIWAMRHGIGGLLHGVNTLMCIPGGLMTDNNEYAAAIVAALPILVYFSLKKEGKHLIVIKIVSILALILSTSAIIFSNSRGAIIGLGGAVFFYLLLVSKKRIRDITVLLIVGVITYSILPQSFFSRMSTIELSTNQSEGSAQKRMHHMRSAFECYKDHPFFGVGPRCYVKIAAKYSGANMEPHDIFIKCAAELGTPGIMLFILIVIVSIVNILRTRTQALISGDIYISTFASFFVISIFGYLTSLIFLNHYYSEYLWLWLGIGNSFAKVYSIHQQYDIAENSEVDEQPFDA